MFFYPLRLVESIPYLFYFRLKYLKLAIYCLSNLSCDKQVKGLVTLGVQVLFMSH